MNDATLREALSRLPLEAGSPAGIPGPLADFLSKPQRIACRRYSLPWLEYRLLAALALSGWSLRYVLVEAEANTLGLALRSGSLLRACAHLTRAGLWESRTVRLSAAVSLVRLTPLGRRLMQEIGLAAVESDWERAERLHRGAGVGQRSHTVALCVFAHHARKRGYTVLLCPDVPGAAEPDVLLTQQGRTIYVEVQGRGGQAWQRANKWRNVSALTPQQAQRYVQEARRVRVTVDRTTDLTTLHRCNPPSLWTHQWVAPIDPSDDRLDRVSRSMQQIRR